MPARLEVNAISKSFGRTRVVSGLSFGVGAGEIVGFVGPNGAGKSTTMRMICGLLRPDSGSVNLDGLRLAREPRRFLARIGVLIESPGYYPSLCAWDHLAYLARVRGCFSRALIDAALIRAGLAPDSRKRVRQFSLGMKQRLGVAMAMIHSPNLLVLDEPMNGLDPSGMVELRQFLRSLAAGDGVSIFVSSHLLYEVEQMCDRVLFIREGRLIEERSLAGDAASQTCLLWLRTENDGRAAALLREQDFIHKVTELPEGLEVGLANADVPRVSTLLVSNGVALREMTPRRQRLEDVYLANYTDHGQIK